MEPVTIGFVAFVLVLVLLALRIPVAIALAGVSTLGLATLHLAGRGSGASADLVAADLPGLIRSIADLLASGDLLVVPLVVLLGNTAFYAGISTRIYDAAAAWLRVLPGGVAMASIMGCGGFAAISGSSVACASTMGRICVPEMLRLGYDPRLATASVAVGGTLGSLIPPSVLFILYGILAQTSIAQLFLAGILPGLLSLAAMLLVVVWWVAEEPQAAPAAGPGDVGRLEAALAAWPQVLLFAVIVVALLGGLLSVAAAAGLCVLMALAIGLAQHRLTAAVLWQALRESLWQTFSIVLIVVAARLFMGFLALTGLEGAVVGWAEGAAPSYFAMIALVVAIYLILGMFLEPVGILILTLPVMLPLVHGYGLDPVWFGVIVVKLLEIGLITPPVGLNVFVIGNVSRDIARERIFAGVARFLAVDILVLLILILFPAIATLIPAAVPAP